MSNIAYLGRMAGFQSAPEFDGYTRVVITVSEDLEYSAGVETGRTLSLECPWGTKKMAENILESIRGFQYQPYSARGALLDPAAELGDGLTVNNLYGGIYSLTTKFGGLCRAEVSAPAEEELDHEYPYVPKQERKVTRRLYSLSTELKVQAGLISAEIEERKSDVKSITAQLTIQSGEIAAKVSKTGGDPESFGWELKSNSWVIKANSQEILKATKNGLQVNGKITATSGKIGGFKINSDSLSYNNQTWAGTNKKGIYIGPNGIQLGKNFKVDAMGNLTAATGTFSGYVKAKRILYGKDENGVDSGYFSGAGISTGSIVGGSGGKIAGATLSTFNLTGGVNTTLGYADFANGVFNDYRTAKVVRCASIRVGDHYYNPVTIYYTNASGGTSYVTVLGYR